jgi:transposase-like protein
MFSSNPYLRSSAMKKNHTCPKCASTNVVSTMDQPFYTKVYPRPAFENSSIVERYVCTDCGYLETYLVEDEELTELKKRL